MIGSFGSGNAIALLPCAQGGNVNSGLLDNSFNVVARRIRERQQVLDMLIHRAPRFRHDGDEASQPDLGAYAYGHDVGGAVMTVQDVFIIFAYPLNVKLPLHERRPASCSGSLTFKGYANMMNTS